MRFWTSRSKSLHLSGSRVSLTGMRNWPNKSWDGPEPRHKGGGITLKICPELDEHPNSRQNRHDNRHGQCQAATSRAAVRRFLPRHNTLRTPAIPVKTRSTGSLPRCAASVPRTVGNSARQTRGPVSIPHYRAICDALRCESTALPHDRLRLIRREVEVKRCKIGDGGLPWRGCAVRDVDDERLVGLCFAAKKHGSRCEAFS
jgi:hypothetical protein